MCLSEYRLEGISNMVGLEHTIANFVMGRHLEDVEVIEFTPLHREKIECRYCECSVGYL